MSAVIDWFSHFYAYLAIFPFIPFIFFWFVGYLWYKDKRKSTKLAMDLTTFLLIGLVSVMIDLTFKSSFGGFWFILLILLVAAGLVGSYQNRIHGKIDPRKLMKIIWRLGFLALSILYFLLLIIGILKNIIIV